ncbi:MAG: replicative DNA helicase [Planctomycetota bacterium]|jgi:replicative DNA helicase
MAKSRNSQPATSSPPQAPPRAGASSERVPPHSIQAEACVLGSMILHAPCIDRVLQIVKPEQFYRPAHQTICKVLIEIHDQRKPIDLISLREALERRKLLEQVGGIDYLVALVEGVPDAANADYYARIVRDKAMLRELITAGHEIVRDAYDSDEEAQKIIDASEQRVFEIRSQQIGDNTSTLDNLIMQVFETIENTAGQLITGIASGYHELDDLTSGFQPGEMIILAGRPSMGKTSMLLNMAEYMGVEDGRPVAFFSLEMSRRQVAQRMLAAHARFDLRRMRRGAIGDEAFTQLQNAADPLYKTPMFIDDTALLTILELRAKARRIKSQHDIHCLFIDYLQLMSYFGRADSRQAQISEISRGLKALARELNIPIVAAAQLNRGPADRPGHRPRMSDLRESGSLEQDADVVMLLHNEDYYHKGEEGYVTTDVTELIIEKQRNGPTGVLRLRFIPEYTRFEAAAPEHVQPYGPAPF